MTRSLVSVLALASVAAFTSNAVHGQTTHFVTLAGTSFSPANLTIAPGDTVQWDWVAGRHDVKSGVGGVPDGIFDSGVPVFAPMSFSVTFDQAFLDANPVLGKVYDYYCSVHVGFGMSGSVTVGVPATLTPRNAGTNPASLSTGGSPIIGTFLLATVDLTTTGHSTALLFGFDTPFTLTLGGGQTLLCLDLGSSGEILSQPSTPGPMAAFGIPVPPDPGLCGFTFSMQAIHFGGVVPFALSNAVDVVVGNI